MPDVSSQLVQYEHHGAAVWVDSDLKGRHRQHCLCYACQRFQPETREGNCPLANQVHALCVEHNLTLPVWECPQFMLKEAMR